MSDVFNEIARITNTHRDKAISSVMLSTGLVLGILTETGLLLDNFKYEFTDYLVLDYLKLNDSYCTESATCTVGHSHEYKTPEHIQHLHVGDRVLVAQFSANNVIVGRVVAHG